MAKSLETRKERVDAPLIVNQPVERQAACRERRTPRLEVAPPSCGLGVRWAAACVIFPGFEPFPWCPSCQGNSCQEGEG